jgi:DNA-binding NarL/FixJ family response regulator
MITLCIATAIPLFREGLLRALDADRGILVSILAGESEAVLRSCSPGRPDVLLLDVSLPGDDTPSLLRRLRQRGYAAPVLLFGHWGRESAIGASRLDVHGMLSMLDDGDAYARAVHAAATGEEFFTPRVLAALREEMAAQVEDSAPAEDLLTPTEMQILRELARNRTSRDIARDMFISYRTVQKHRSNITRKLKLDGTNALLAYAIRRFDGDE